MLGQQSVATLIFCLGVFFIIILFAANLSLLIYIFLFIALLFMIMAFVWINWSISYSGFQAGINKINPEKEEIWADVSKDHLLTLQLVPKGVYGQTKGIMRGHKADVIDKGDFPIRLKNGNSAILVYDLLSHNLNLNHAVSWKQIFKKEKVRSGEEAYRKAMDVIKDA